MLTQPYQNPCEIIQNAGLISTNSCWLCRFHPNTLVISNWISLLQKDWHFCDNEVENRGSFDIKGTLQIYYKNLVWKSTLRSRVRIWSSRNILKCPEDTRQWHVNKLLKHSHITWNSGMFLKCGPCFKFQIHFPYSLSLPEKWQDYCQKQQKPRKQKPKQNKIGIWLFSKARKRLIS